jgi:hypothetical protein
MTKNHIGVLHERRGDDYFNFYTSQDGDVVEVQQFDSIRRRWETINFFSETAASIVAMIQKAAGIQDAPVEYEYNIEETDTLTGVKSVHGFWGGLESKRLGIKRLRAHEQMLADYTEDKKPNTTFNIVRRVKVGYEVVEGE